MPFRKVPQKETETELRELSADPENTVCIVQSMADARLKHLLHAAREEASYFNQMRKKLPVQSRQK